MPGLLEGTVLRPTVPECWLEGRQAPETVCWSRKAQAGAPGSEKARTVGKAAQKGSEKARTVGTVGKAAKGKILDRIFYSDVIV